MARSVFHGTIRENIDLGRASIGQSGVREALRDVGLNDVVLRLPNGLMTDLQTGGYPLNHSEIVRLVIARAIVSKPRALVIHRLLDDLNADLREQLWSYLTHPSRNWTLIVVTDDEQIASRCDTQIAVRGT